MTVYILIREDQSELGYIDTSIVGVYTSEAKAEAGRAAEAITARAAGLVVEDEETSDGEWQVSWKIQAHDVDSDPEPWGVLDGSRTAAQRVGETTLTAGQREVLDALRGDIAATLAVADETAFSMDLERQASEILRLFDWTRHDLSAFTSKLVDDLQQRIHDEFIDVSWPRCPRHPNHPMWLKAGTFAWWCQRDDVKIGALGDLPRRR